MEAQDGDLDADPVVITSKMYVGENSLLTPESVDTADEYGNIVNDSPIYGASSDVGLATVDANKACSIIFTAADVGETATVTIGVSGVASSKRLQIKNIGSSSPSTTTIDPNVTTTSTTIDPNVTTTIDPNVTTTIDPNATTTTTATTDIIVDFGASPQIGSAPHTVYFTNLSTGDIDSYEWNFGDGNTDTDESPTHIYDKMGVYGITLTAFGTDGSSVSEFKPAFVSVTPACPFLNTLDSQEDIGVLRTLRNSVLDNLFGLILTCIYYQNADEIASILNENPGLQHDLRDLVGENINVAGDLINGKGASVSKDSVNDVIEFLNELKREGSPRLKNDIRIVIDAIRAGYFLYGLGVKVK